MSPRAQIRKDYSSEHLSELQHRLSDSSKHRATSVINTSSIMTVELTNKLLNSWCLSFVVVHRVIRQLSKHRPTRRSPIQQLANDTVRLNNDNWLMPNRSNVKLIICSYTSVTCCRLCLITLRLQVFKTQLKDNARRNKCNISWCKHYETTNCVRVVVSCCRTFECSSVNDVKRRR